MQKTFLPTQSKNRSRFGACVLFCSLNLGLVCSAQGAEDLNPQTHTDLTLQEIKELKIKAEKTYRDELTQCYQKFAVNQCKDRANQQRVDELSRLRLLEIEINKNARAQRAEQLERDNLLKKQAREKEDQAAALRANSEYQIKLKDNQEKNDLHSPDSDPSKLPKPSPTLSGVKAEDRHPLSPPESDARAKYDAKQREALEHKQEVQRRLEEKAKSKQ